MPSIIPKPGQIWKVDLVDSLGNLLVRLFGLVELLQAGSLGRHRENARQGLHTVPRLIGAGLEQFKKLVIFAQEFLQGEHSGFC